MQQIHSGMVDYYCSNKLLVRLSQVVYKAKFTFSVPRLLSVSTVYVMDWKPDPGPTVSWDKPHHSEVSEVLIL